jgi:mannose-6-phosphate isomerase-like protein (cupin superfamily)
LKIAATIQAPWQPVPALDVNQARLRVVKYEGRYPDMHRHEIDECYVVLEGELVLEIDGAPSEHLARGDAYVMRAGVVHRPFAMPRATVLLIT